MEQGLIAVFILLSLINCGAMLEQRRWVLNLELTRLVVLWAMLYAVTGSPMLIILAYIGGLYRWFILVGVPVPHSTLLLRFSLRAF